jgi:hypothetical protein
MSELRNWKHEDFAKRVAAGTDLAEAFALAGYEAGSAEARNYNRLAKRPDVAARISELKLAREAAARAARVPADQVLGALSARGVERLDDFFERDAAGVLRTRDLQVVPVEVSIGLLRLLREALAIQQAVP